MAFKRSTALIVFLLLGIMVAVAAIGRPLLRKHLALRPPQTNPEPGTLDWYAQTAQAQGLSAYSFSAGITEYPAPLWDTALDNSNVAVAQLMTARSYPIGEDNIVTWYKFKIQEWWRQGAACGICAGSDLIPPDDMLPVNADEILVRRSGGSLQVNGINLNSVETSFPQLNFTNKYVLLLQQDSSHPQVAHLWLGSNGVFPVIANDQLATVDVLDTTGSTPNQNPYTDVIQSRYANSFSQMRASFGMATTTPTPTPTPASCDPNGTKRQSCLYDGGTWDPASCYCELDPCIKKPWLYDCL